MADRADPRRADMRSASLLFGLAPSGVYQANQVTLTAGELLPHRFTLTASQPAGSDVAVCFLLHYSLTSRPVGVTHHRVLWSPDFPPAAGGSPRTSAARATGDHPVRFALTI